MNQPSQSGTTIYQILDIMQELDILSYYKNFPVTCPAKFEGVRDTVVIFKVSPPNSVCLESAKTVWLLGGELFEAMKADIVSFNLVTGILEVTRLTYPGFKFGNRKIARVEPGEKIPVTIISEESGEKATGKIVDISMGGAGILLDSSQTFQIISGEPIRLQMTLPNEPNNPIELHGKILTRSLSSRSRLGAAEPSLSEDRFSTTFTASLRAKTALLAFIARRRAELMEEIKQLYAASLKKRTSQ